MLSRLARHIRLVNDQSKLSSSCGCEICNNTSFDVIPLLLSLALLSHQQHPFSQGREVPPRAGQAGRARFLRDLPASIVAVQLHL